MCVNGARPHPYCGGMTVASLWTLVLATTSITLGLLWDISWHTAIGRDSFWSPPHVAVYLGSLLAGGVGLWFVVTTTLESGRLDGGALHIGPLRAPLGAWVVLWGELTMCMAAGFDNWWHRAYGLDVAILTPAHALLGVGMVSVHVGAILLVVTAKNRQGANSARGLERLQSYLGGVLLFLVATLLMECNFPNHQHSATFYLISCGTYPFLLVAMARASGNHWPATRIANVYMALTLAMLWTLPIFAAQPRLGPIFNPVDHMWPGLFPLLLIVPALAMDVATRFLGRDRAGLLACVLAALFVAIFPLVQWYFSAFLLSPRARTPLFAADQWYFSITNEIEGTEIERMGAWRHRFWRADSDPVNFRAVGYCLILSALGARAGLSCGNWMNRLRR